MHPFFADLVSRTDEVRRSFENNPVVLDAVAHGMSIQRYRKFLLEIYHIVWHFNPVTAAAASRMPDSHRQVRYHFYEHMHEESGHEQWVLNDLDAVGVTAQDARAYPASPDTLAMCGFNYWQADRGNPCSVLGMLYALEVIASVYGGTFTSAIKESLLLVGERGTSFIGSHATMDVAHMASLRVVLNTLQDDAAQDAVVESTIVNFHLLTRIFASV